MKSCEAAIVSIGQTTANTMDQEMRKPDARPVVFDLHQAKALVKAGEVNEGSRDTRRGNLRREKPGTRL